MSIRTPRPGAVPAGRTRTPSTEWMVRGACRQVSGIDFFPSQGSGVAAAQKICAGCEVRGACLDYALSEGISHGVWGGTSDRERQRLRAARQRSGFGAYPG